MHSPRTSKLPSRHRRSLSVALVAVGLAVAIAACGSSGSPSTAAASGGPLLKLAECMRSHGVSNFPDPSPNGGGLAIPSTINTQAPAFQSAQNACAKSQRGGSHGSAASENQYVAMLTIAKCMRKHGVPDFSDPTHSPQHPAAATSSAGTGFISRSATRSRRRSSTRRPCAGSGCLDRRSVGSAAGWRRRRP